MAIFEVASKRKIVKKMGILVAHNMENISLCIITKPKGHYTILSYELSWLWDHSVTGCNSQSTDVFIMIHHKSL